MNIPDGYTLTYIVQAEAYYAHVVKEPGLSVVLRYDDEGGCRWEFQVKPYDFCTSKAVQLQIFEDAFEAFAMIPEFFEEIRQQKPNSLAEVRQILDGIGAVDATDRRTQAADRRNGGPYPVAEQDMDAFRRMLLLLKVQFDAGEIQRVPNSTNGDAADLLYR